jgi:hypothetical protein
MEFILAKGLNPSQGDFLPKTLFVLCFGNSKSNKPKILTIGANPSRWEF